MHPDERAIRQQLIDVCLRLNHSGLNTGRSGNASIRWKNMVLITPTGMPYESLQPEDIVCMDIHGKVAQGQRMPSSEWHFHTALLAARPECSAILHAHSPKATTLSVLRQDLPAVHYMIAVAGGDTVRCAPYATFGTMALAHHAVLAMRNRKACLLADHGIITAGGNIHEAFAILQEIEGLCRIYLEACQTGQPVVLSDDEMASVCEKFQQYGRQSNGLS